MSVKIRLRRMGQKKRPCYRVVVADSRFKRDGRFIEAVGTYNPKSKDEAQTQTIKNDRVSHWLSVGAQPSETVWSLLKNAGINKSVCVKTRKTKKAKAAREAAKA